MGLNTVVPPSMNPIVVVETLPLTALTPQKIQSNALKIKSYNTKAKKTRNKLKTAVTCEINDSISTVSTCYSPHRLLLTTTQTQRMLEIMNGTIGSETGLNTEPASRVRPARLRARIKSHNLLNTDTTVIEKALELNTKRPRKRAKKSLVPGDKWSLRRCPTVQIDDQAPALTLIPHPANDVKASPKVLSSEGGATQDSGLSSLPTLATKPELGSAPMSYLPPKSAGMKFALDALYRSLQEARMAKSGCVRLTNNSPPQDPLLYGSKLSANTPKPSNFQLFHENSSTTRYPLRNSSDPSVCNGGDRGRKSNGQGGDPLLRNSKNFSKSVRAQPSTPPTTCLRSGHTAQAQVAPVCPPMPAQPGKRKFLGPKLAPNYQNVIPKTTGKNVSPVAKGSRRGGRKSKKMSLACEENVDVQPEWSAEMEIMSEIDPTILGLPSESNNAADVMTYGPPVAVNKINLVLAHRMKRAIEKGLICCATTGEWTMYPLEAETGTQSRPKKNKNINSSSLNNNNHVVNAKTKRKRSQRMIDNLVDLLDVPDEDGENSQLGLENESDLDSFTEPLSPSNSINS